MKSLFAVTLSLGLIGASAAVADCPGHSAVSADAGPMTPIVTADSSHSNDTGTATTTVTTDRKG